MQYAPTEFVTSASGFTSLGLGLYATFTCVDSAARQGRVFQRVELPSQKAGQSLGSELWVGGGNAKD